MKNDHHNPADEAQHRIENELKKLNLEMEHGAKFGGSGDLPIEVESQWLDYITAFENQSKTTTVTSLYTFLGQPEFTPFDMLQPEDVVPELDRLFDLMKANNVHLDFLTKYSVETVYRFVTEEFFLQPMSNMRIPGMIHGFIYEEFHPNHEHHLKGSVENFFNSMMNLESDFKMYFLSPIMATETSKEPVDKKVYEKRIESFRNQYKTLKINQLEILEVEVKNIDDNNKFAGVVFGLDYEGVLKEEKKRVQYRGTGYLNFAYIEEYWSISRIVFRGFDVC